MSRKKEPEPPRLADRRLQPEAIVKTEIGSQSVRLKLNSGVEVYISSAEHGRLHLSFSFADEVQEVGVRAANYINIGYRHTGGGV